MKRLLFLLVCLPATVHGDCTVPSWEVLSTLERPARYLVSADFNGDFRPDLAGSTLTDVFVALNDGSGKLNAPAVVHTGSLRSMLLSDDFNGDDRSDLAFVSGNSFIVLPGAGDGTFGVPIESPLGINADIIDAGTFDSGETTDIVAVDSAGRLLVLFTNSGTGFAERARLSLNADPASMVAGDLDSDGRLDVAVGYQNDATIDAFFGNGEGSFSKVLIQGSGPTALRAADMDGDSLTDLVQVRYERVSIIRNLGGRSFGDPLSYWFYADRAYDIAPVDLTGDGILDVAAATGTCSLMTATGTGIGTLEHVYPHYGVYGSESEYCHSSSESGYNDITHADFDRDGRTDVAISRLLPAGDTRRSLIKVLRNLCGDGIVTLTSNSPTISVGQTLRLEVAVGPRSGSYGFYGTGDVTITRAGQVVASATLSNGSATIPINGLTSGEHTFVAEYDGDGQYEPLQSEPFLQRVTTEETATTIEIDQSEGVYGRVPTITARVTSSTGRTVSGSIAIEVNGVLSPPWLRGDAPTMTYPASFEPGTYTYRAHFLGGENDPPSSSQTITFVVRKATPTLTASPSLVVAGTSLRLSVDVHSPFGGDSPSGPVTVSEEGQVLGEGRSILLPPFSQGHHSLLIQYPGDDHYNAVTRVISIEAVTASAATVFARGSASEITVTWHSSNSGSLVRRKASEPWGTPCCLSWPFHDTGTLPDTVYLYRFESSDGTNVSAADVGMRVNFTDDPLVPGTEIRAVHVQEIVLAANRIRAAAGLPVISTEPFARGGLVQATQLLQLRSSINEARERLGAYAFPFTAAIERGGLIRAAHIEQLRESVR